MARQLKEGTDYVKIYGVPHQVHDDLINISKNLGVTLTGMLKPELRKIADSYSPELKKPPVKD